MRAKAAGDWGQAAVRGLGGFSVGLCRTVPALAGRLGGRMSFRAMREEVGCSPSMLAPARFRCRWVAFGDRLPGELREQGTGCGPGVGRVFGGALRDRACARRKAWGRMSFRAMREGVGCSPSMLAPARSRCRWVTFWGQATWGIFRDRLLLLVRDRLPGELPARWGQAAEGF